MTEVISSDLIFTGRLARRHEAAQL